MDSLRFFRLAFKLASYQGAVRAQAENTSEEHENTTEVSTDVRAVVGQKTEADARAIGAPWIEFETA